MKREVLLPYCQISYSGGIRSGIASLLFGMDGPLPGAAFPMAAEIDTGTAFLVGGRVTPPPCLSHYLATAGSEQAASRMYTSCLGLGEGGFHIQIEGGMARSGACSHARTSDGDDMVARRWLRRPADSSTRDGEGEGGGPRSGAGCCTREIHMVGASGHHPQR